MRRLVTVGHPMTPPSTDNLPGRTQLTPAKTHQARAERIIRKTLAPLDWLTGDEHDTLAAELRATLSHDSTMPRSMRRGAQRCAVWQDTRVPMAERAIRVTAAAVLSVIRSSDLGSDEQVLAPWRIAGKRMNNVMLHSHAKRILAARYHQFVDDTHFVTRHLKLEEWEMEQLHNDALDIIYGALCRS